MKKSQNNIDKISINQLSVICELQRKVRNLRSALLFYSKSKNWKMKSVRKPSLYIYGSERISETEDDNGRIARLALKNN